MSNPKNISSAVAIFLRDHERDELTFRHGCGPVAVARECGCPGCTLWLWLVESPDSHYRKEV